MEKKFKFFLIAFTIRIVLGYIFFGSIDLINQIVIAKQIIAGNIIYIPPYFPLVSIIIWFGTLINSFTALPIAFSFKIIPVFFDSLIPLLIFDIVSKRSGVETANKSALLYAFSPVAIIINVFHVQLDSIFLFFLILAFYIRDFYQNSYRKYFLFGVLYAISFMVKPVALIALPIFIQPLSSIAINVRHYFKRQLVSVIGCLLIVMIFFLIFKFFGYSIKELIKGIFSYSNNGVQIFGLPFAYPFSQILFLKTRIWLILIIVIISLFYHFRRMDSYTYLLSIFSISFGFSGLCDQYLIWLVPFLIILGYFRFDLIFNLYSTLFLMLYYINPQAPYYAWENMDTFVTLKKFSWLMPGMNYAQQSLLPLIKILGNYGIPLFSIFLFTHILRKALKKSTLRDHKNLIIKNIKPLIVKRNLYLILIFIFLITHGLLYFLADKSKLLINFNLTYDSKIAEYNFIPTNIISLSIHYIGNYTNFSSIFNIINLFLLFSIMRSVLLMPVELKRKIKYFIFTVFKFK